MKTHKRKALGLSYVVHLHASPPMQAKNSLRRRARKEYPYICRNILVFIRKMNNVENKVYHVDRIPI